MIDQPHATDVPHQPAPRWTPEKQREFLEALARCGSVKSSAAFVGMSRESAYRLRRRQEGRAFDRAWDAALIHARDLYAETLLETGLNGWTETVWYHGEEVGERTRFSPGLLLAALARLDAKADGLDLAGEPVREAAADFDTMVEAIGEGDDCAAMLEAQDRAAQARRAPPPNPYRTEASDEELLERLEMFHERELIAAMAPEDVDTSDLDPYEADDWDDLQWARAERSGMMDQPGFWEKANPEGYDDDDHFDGSDDWGGPDKKGPSFH
ncbi:hypothetical protein [Sphingorhabdus sp. YGSMI21]|uniref:hypothetical protein n=1 Tax=Sphingorhabdus sp. YGSMI21 TaxID=2077182 RepID=UPI000C1EA731|nr:hypothetical protein [Sphingorhabdus sp. YGSMI21]ATW02790.1 hypothetical protein CHN51_04035 [Sphingorhabdus sp. YGSMI21]